MPCAGCAQHVEEPEYDREGRAWHPRCLQQARDRYVRRRRSQAAPQTTPTDDYLAWGTARFGLHHR